MQNFHNLHATIPMRYALVLGRASKNLGNVRKMSHKPRDLEQDLRCELRKTMVSS